MGVLFAMTLPALVILLVLVALVDATLGRRRRRRGEVGQRPQVAAVGFNGLGLVLAPNTKHKQEHDEHLELKRDEQDAAAPPLSEVDLDAGTALIRLPKRC